MSHPTPGELLEHHFGEAAASGLERAVLERHLAACAACRTVVADVAWLEEALAAEPTAAPPADGLERVLARVEQQRPVRERRQLWLRALGPSAAGLVAGMLAVHTGGWLAALAFFGVGSLLTLALAPVLILEAQGRS